MSTHVGSLKIEIDGDRATAAIEGIAHHVVRDGDGQRIVVANAPYYLDYTRRGRLADRVDVGQGRSDRAP